MKKLLGIAILMFGCFIVNAQGPVSSLSTSKINQDTINQNDTLYITPYYGKTLTSSMGNFAYVKSDKIAFQTYQAALDIHFERPYSPIEWVY